jgi:integrase
MMKRMVKCPECGSLDFWKDGLRYYPNGDSVQRYLCRNCGFRFSENHNSFKDCQTNKKSIQICATLQGVKNLDTATEPKTVAGEIGKQEQDVKGKLIEFAWHLKRENESERTIATYTALLKSLMNNGANLFDPNTVKDVLAKLERKSSTKAVMTAAYTCFLRFLGLSWSPPHYEFQHKIPFIPTEAEIDSLIAGCGKTTAAILQTLKETGMRIGEACRLKWTDLNLENNTLILNEPEKHNNPRIFKISPTLVGVLQSLPKRDVKIFGRSSVKNKQTTFLCQRNRLARKLGNPRLTQITFHTLRHWKATMEYHKTHNPWYVKQLLGHKSLQSTELYINIEQAIFNEGNQEFHVIAAATIDEACKLLESGFEYVTDMEGKKLFRKRK